MRREDALERLASTRFDLLVIGGGIIGAGIAAHASRMGLAVALVEANDFASGTSGASSKLIHGGLRYLRLGDVRLVREAHIERRLLETVVAPHLVHRVPFLFPLYRSGPYRPLTVEAGILAYSTLAREKPQGLIGPARARRIVPGLRTDGLRRCAAYMDAWTDDARLTLANVTAAAEAGGIVVNRARVAALRLVGGRVVGAEVEAGDATIPVLARVVVNAAGPRVDEVRCLESPAAGTTVRLSKGAHALLDLAGPMRAALTIPHDDVRVSFAVPWRDQLLLGTTDDPVESPDDGLTATETDVQQILTEAGVALEPELLERSRVRATFSGLRVLPVGQSTSVNTRRETVYTVGSGGMLSVAGGKLTTSRRIALGALDRVRNELGIHTLDRLAWPLPGAERHRSLAGHSELDLRTRSHLESTYGARAALVLALAADDPSLLEPLSPLAPEIAAQVVYAGRHEWAADVDDVLWRRTGLGYRGATDSVVRARIASLLETG
ncbi:MAG: glycerol-3-phosphate dehydrogenase/oxidase [Gaiella sp.]